MLLINKIKALLILLSIIHSFVKCYDISDLINMSSINETLPVQRSKDGKSKLTIALMLPQDFMRLRNFRLCINKEIVKINKSNWSFTKHFYLDRLVLL